MRLNIGIDPSKLSDEHLYAESRELKFMPAYFKRYGMSGVGRVPEKFALAPGLILFFAYKPTYTLSRYKKVLKECWRRGIDAKDESWRWDVYGEMKDSFKEEGWERNIIIDRIVEKVMSSPKQYFHYNHRRITKEEVVKILTEK